MGYWDFRAVDAELLALLADSPITRESVLSDVRGYHRAGEIALAFDTLCTWLYEDHLPISRAYYDRLRSLSEEVHSPASVDRLDELISE